jgi:pre-mRNA-splicing helicase BRR2
LKLYVFCDSYIGADHDIALEPIQVAEGEDSDSDEDMNSGDDK